MFLLFTAGFSMTIGAVDVIKLLNLLRSEVELTSVFAGVVWFFNSI
jgi:hypothetical protein